MKRYINLGYLLMASMLLVATPVFAQKQKAKKTPMLQVKMVVVDKNDQPIENVELITGEGSVVDYSDAKGFAEVRAKANGVVLVEALGYKSVMIDLSKEQVPAKLTLEAEQLFASEEHNKGRGDGGFTTQQALTGAVSTVTGDEISTFADYSLSNTLAGRIAGLTVSQNNSGLGNNNSALYVRGQHRNGANQALVIVDGMERSMDDIIPEEVESIDVMKDATAKILYGARAANGVIVVTTQRGKANKRVMNVNFESGVMMATRTPEYLDSYDYATLYNEARANDGKAPFYSQAQLDGYKNSAGSNDVLYPNTDFYNDFLGTTNQFNKAVFDLYGGDKIVKYSMVASYLGGDGYESVGQESILNRFNARGNLDIKVNDVISFYADAAARLELRTWGALDGGTVYGNVTSLRPNEYPLTLSPDVLGFDIAESDMASDGVPIFGANYDHANNLLAQMQYGGITSERYVTSQTRIGTEINLEKLVSGLKAGANMLFDNYTYYKENQIDKYATYAIRDIKEDGTLEFIQMQNQTLADNMSRSGYLTRRYLSWNANMSYANSFGKSDVSALLNYKYDEQQQEGATQDLKNDNTSLRVNYGYDSRYMLEGSVALMGSNRFAIGNRFFTSWALGGAWVVSNEDFMKSSKAFDFLKLKASYGLLGYDTATGMMSYQTAWNQGTAFKAGEKNSTTFNTTNFVRFGTDAEWESSSEFNVGVEALMFGKRLSAEVNYFDETRNNIIGSTSAFQADVVGDYVTLGNVGTVHNHGVDAYVAWSERRGDFSYQVGANMVWSRNKLVAWNEVAAPDKYTLSVGQPTDVMMGYTSEGLFGKDVALEGSNQLLGQYQEGDIAYKDINNDGVVDARDKSALGNSFPRTTLGIDIDLKYKGWGLYALGTAELGVNAWLNNKYYWVSGEDKYSTQVLDRWHPTNNPTGSYPRLTTTSGANNFVNSDFWLEDASFFRLKNVELSYTFGFKNSNLSIKKLKLFARGNNLFVLSKIKDLDPEVIDAGVTNYPVSRTITGGVSISF